MVFILTFYSLYMGGEIKKIILDTNFLLIPYCNKIDIFDAIAGLVHSGYRFVMPSTVINELKRLAKNRGKEGLGAKLALKIIEARKKDIEIIETSIWPDEWITEFAEKEHAIVCTNDTKLRQTIKKCGLSVICLKSLSRIDFV